MDIIWEELESPSMNPCLLLIIVTTKFDYDLLNCFLLFLGFNFNIRNLDFIYSQAIDSLTSSLNHRPFLNEELISVLPVVPSVNIDIEPDILFLKPDSVLALFKTLNLKIVDSMLVVGILDKLS